MKYFLFLFSIVSLPLFGQEANTNHQRQPETVMIVHPHPVPLQDSNDVFTICQQMPKFKGDLNTYLSENIRYPEAERKAGTTGTVYITFVVEKNGSVTGVKVLRGVVNGPGLDAEGVRVISSMPAWTPGMQNGNVIRVQYNLPIHFQIN
jgi:protein TonB